MADAAPSLNDLVQKFQAQMDASAAAFSKQMNAAVSAFTSGTRMPPLDDSGTPTMSTSDWALVARILQDPVLKAKVIALVAEANKAQAAAPG